MKTPETTNPKAETKPSSTPKKRVIDPTATPPAPGAPAANGKNGAKPAKRVLRILTMDDVLNYEHPEGADLVAEGFIELGEVALLYGPPGSFKGFAVGELMVKGAVGSGSWLGFPVQTKFKSLWINCENGRKRLKKQFQKMTMPPDVRDYVFTTDQPDSFSLADPALASEIREAVIERDVRLLIIDTVSNFTEDELAKHFTAFFEALYAILRDLPVKPAVLLIHHSRKPKSEDRGGRSLLNLISGHQTLQRRSRSIIYMGRPTEGFKEKRVVAVALKVSNNGELEGEKAAMQLGPGHTLDTLEDFDWSEWEKSSEGNAEKKPKGKIQIEHLQKVFQGGALTRAETTRQLMALCECGDSAVSDAIGKTRDGIAKGRLCYAIEELPGGILINLKPEYRAYTSPVEEE